MLMAGLKNTIDAGQEKRRRGFEKENTKMSEKILEYKEQNPNSTQREIADACDCSLGKVNKTLKKSTLLSDNSYTYSNSNNNDNSNLNINTMNVNTNTFSISEDSEKKRELDNLTSEELRELLRDYERKVPYGKLYKKYNLISNCLNKSLPMEIETVFRKRREETKMLKCAEELGISLEDYKFLVDSFTTVDDGVKGFLEDISECLDGAEIDAKIMVKFFKENPYATVKKQGFSDDYFKYVSYALSEKHYI